MIINHLARGELPFFFLSLLGNTSYLGSKLAARGILEDSV